MTEAATTRQEDEMSVTTFTQQRTAKDAAAFVASLDEAMRTRGGRVELVSIDGTTKSGRQRFTVRFTYDR